LSDDTQILRAKEDAFVNDPTNQELFTDEEDEEDKTDLVS
jgi:hypothetical protein